METKDTVMNKDQMEEVKYLEIRDNPEYHDLRLLHFEKRSAEDRAIAKAQAEITLKKRNEEVDATVKAALGQSSSHCNQHKKFTDECMACHNTCNKDVDWKLFNELQEIKQEGRREVVEWINKNPVYIQSNSLGIKVPIAATREWDAKLKEWGIEE
jgi:hypothetical protein